MSAPAAYTLEGVTQVRSGREVLRIDRLSVASGGLLCLVGPTGAGKSTLLRLLAGLEAPATGRLLLGGQPLEGREPPPDVRRRVTLVFQNPLLLAGTVRANVEYGLWLQGERRPRPRADEALGQLGLGHLADRPARALSGGETRRVALARALAIEPEVLLLDEPTAHLDPAQVGLVEQVIGEYHRGRKGTIVWASHSIFQVRRLADRVAFLLDGQLVEEASACDFFNAPRDPRTAAFARGEMVY